MVAPFTIGKYESVNKQFKALNVKKTSSKNNIENYNKTDRHVLDMEINYASHVAESVFAFLEKLRINILCNNISYEHLTEMLGMVRSYQKEFLHSNIELLIKDMILLIELEIAKSETRYTRQPKYTIKRNLES